MHKLMEKVWHLCYNGSVGRFEKADLKPLKIMSNTYHWAYTDTEARSTIAALAGKRKYENI
jgi:hypothetical protein